MNRRAFRTTSWILILLIVTGFLLLRDRDHSLTNPAAQSGEGQRVPLALPPIDNRAALDKAEKIQDRGVYRFAEAIPVQISPLSHGTWETLPSGGERWTLEIASPGASSLNFGFSRYSMPEGGSLTIQKPGVEPAFRSFTAADNESHGQLWTPLLRSDTALISLEIADGNRESAVLELASVNHGFRHEKIGGSTSGSCNIDVNCDASSLPGIGAMIEMFADQIRSVGAYTLNGTDTCTGALINNTANDRRPFFLTAAHCGINTENAPSMVVFWNFQNSTCRTPNTTESGRIGDGDLSQFNTGATFRAGNSTTDFTLVEFDDPIGSDVDAYYAGWNRTGANPESVIGIHHPAVAEKRISFSFTRAQTTSSSGTSSPGNGNYVRVVSWDNGTTEGGSSGSPLFDPSGRIIGQLFGGAAACGNTDSDWYGRVSRSWTGGGTSATRLSDWLDPINSGATTLNGVDLIQALTIVGSSGSENEVGDIAFTISLSEPIDGITPQTIKVDYTTADGTAEAGSDYTATSGTLNFAPGETTATVTVPVLKDTDAEENETFELTLSNAQPSSAAFIASTKASATILNDDFITPIFPILPSTSGAVGERLSIQLTAENTPTEFGLSGPVPPGMRINTTSGIITWIPANPGQVSVTVSAANTTGSDTATLTIDVTENPLLTAIDNTNFSTSQGIGAPWTSQNSVTFDGIDAIQSATLGDNGSSEFVLEVEGAGVLEFHWRVSSEADFDILSFAADGKTIARISGETAWQRYVYRLGSGSHRFVWRYAKDFSQSAGSDSAWLDAVTFVSAASDNALFPIADARIPSGAPYVQRVESIPPTATLSTGELPRWLTLSDDGFLTGTPPAGNSEVRTISLTATHEGTSSLSSFEITTGASLDFSDEVGAGDAVAFFAGSDTSWRSITGGADSGSTSIRSGNIENNESSSISASVTGPSTLSFAWRVSSEQNFDLFRFFLDKIRIFQISGDIPWQNFSITIPEGRHNVEWRYTKDISDSAGLDRAYVDSVSLSGYGEWIASQPVNGFTAPSYDPDADNRENFMEYALGTNPNSSDLAERLTYNFDVFPPTINLAKPQDVVGVHTS